MLPSDIGNVETMLTDLQVDDNTVKQIVAILEEQVSNLDSGRPGKLNAAYLGASDAGQLLGFHTDLAHQHVVTAMEQMMAGLRGYRDNIEHFHKSINFHDEDSGSASTKMTTKVGGIDAPTIDQSTSCTSAPDVHDNPSCTLPTGGN